MRERRFIFHEGTQWKHGKFTDFFACGRKSRKRGKRLCNSSFDRGLFHKEDTLPRVRAGLRTEACTEACAEACAEACTGAGHCLLI